MNRSNGILEASALRQATSRQTIINVSNRLPVTVGEQGIQRSSGGLVAALAGVPTEQFELCWVGWPGPVTSRGHQEQVRAALEQEHGLVPVFLSAEQAEAHYEG